MAAEDAAIMTGLFRAVQNREDIPKAFQAFDNARRGPENRPDWVTKNGGKVALLCAGQKGLDPKTAVEGLPDMPELFAYLWEADVRGEVKRALDLFEEIMAK